MKVKEPDLLEFTKWFEMALNQATKVERQDKMKMRRKIRDELYILLSWESPTPDVIFNRWEERLEMVFKVMNSGLRDDVGRLKMHNFPFPDGIVQTDYQIFNLFNGI
jgi:hypothetical protein